MKRVKSMVDTSAEVLEIIGVGGKELVTALHTFESFTLESLSFVVLGEEVTPECLKIDNHSDSPAMGMPPL